MTGPQFAELFEWLRIPSVSADPRHRADVLEAGRWVADFIVGAGGTATVIETGGHPLVVGDIPASVDGPRPTVLLYGHHDVQPPGSRTLWESPPFEPQLRNGWVYARGASDDKGPFFALLAAARELAERGELPVDVRIVSDGEEEILGDSVLRWMGDQEPVADVAIIFDGLMAGIRRPAFVEATRGMASFRVRLRTGERDLHSGFFGGAALNAAHALVELLTVARRRWLESAASAREPVPESWSALEPGAAILDRAGARPADEAAAEAFHVRTLALSTMEVTGIRVGETELQHTAIPVEATASVSLRLVHSEAPAQAAESFAAIVERSAPVGADVQVEVGNLTPGVLLPPSPAVDRAAEAFAEAFGVAPVITRSGGTLPVVLALAERGVPTVVTGLDVHQGNAHGPNERLLVEHLNLGIEAAKATLIRLAGRPGE